MSSTVQREKWQITIISREERNNILDHVSLS